MRQGATETTQPYEMSTIRTPWFFSNAKSRYDIHNDQLDPCSRNGSGSISVRQISRRENKGTKTARDVLNVNTVVVA